jgi:hypothetical protein
MLNLDDSTIPHAIKPAAAPNSQLLDAFSPTGTFIATAHHKKSTITITSLKNQNPSPAQFIDTDLEISAMVLTDSILLVKGSTVVSGDKPSTVKGLARFFVDRKHSETNTEKIVAWLLTEEGVVDGIVGNTRADHNDSLWELPISQQAPMAIRKAGGQDRPLKFTAEGEIAVLSMYGYTIHAYNTRTGEVLKPAEAPKFLESTWYHFDDQREKGCNQYHHDLCKHQQEGDSEWPISQVALQEGWVKDPEGKCRLWLQPSWRSAGNDVDWLNNASTLRVRNSSELLVVKF